MSIKSYFPSIESLIQNLLSTLSIGLQGSSGLLRGELLLIVTGFLAELGVALSSYVTAVWQLYLSFAVIGCIGAGGF